MAQVPALLTVSEVASLCRVDASTVRRWIAREQLPAVRLPGGQYRIRSQDADALQSAA
jgi:excisionase family DNA binding protein